MQNIQGFKKFKKQTKNYFSNYLDFFLQNPLNNIKSLDSAFNQLVMHYYYILMNDPLAAGLNLKETVNKLNTIVGLINYCINNNQESPKLLQQNFLDEYADIQGNLLANCLKLIEFDMNFQHTQVIIFYIYKYFILL